VYVHTYIHTYIHTYPHTTGYGVATISRLLKIIGLSVEYRLLYRALLQQRPMILRSLLIVATPYDRCSTHNTGSLKILFSFAKEPYKIDDILQKRPVIFLQIHVLLPLSGWYMIYICRMQVSFAVYRFFYRALLQKRPIFYMCCCLYLGGTHI